MWNQRGRSPEEGGPRGGAAESPPHSVLPVALGDTYKPSARPAERDTNAGHQE